MGATIWKDTIHGFKANARSKTIAWALIRNKCYQLKLKVPMLNEIIKTEE